MPISRIVSGGQTGVDLAALDVAIALGMDCGGWVPKGCLNEAGAIPPRYPGLIEAHSERSEVRTELNVRDSDATLILASSELQGGTLYTLKMAKKYGRPFMHVDLNEVSQSEAVNVTIEWLDALGPFVTLNVAGPRASEDPGIYDKAKRFLERLLYPRSHLFHKTFSC